MTHRASLIQKEDKMIQQTIRLYLLLRALSTFGVSFIAAVYVMFLMTRGLNLFEVNLVNAVFFTTMFLFEIPTGAVADVFGRKTSFVVSNLLWGTSMFLYSTADTFWGFAAAEAVAAIGATFASGAFQAWLVDKLRHHGHTGALSQVFAREQQVTSALAVIGGLVGAYLSDRFLPLPWLVGGGVMLIAALIAQLTMREEYFTPQKFSFRAGLASMKNTVKTSFHYGVRQKTVRFILLIGTIQYLAVMAPNMQWQPLFLPYLNSKTELGYLWAAIALSTILGAQLAPGFLKKTGSERLALVISQVIIGLGVLGAVATKMFPLALAAFLIHELGRGAFRPLKDHYLNDNIPSSERATLLSFESLTHHIGGLIGLILSGLLAQSAGIPAAWVFAGLVLVVGSLLVAKTAAGSRDQKAVFK